MINNFEYEFTFKSVTLFKKYAVLQLEYQGIPETLYTFRLNTAMNTKDKCNRGDVLYIRGKRQKDKNGNIQHIANEIFLMDGDSIKENMSKIEKYTIDLEQDI